MSWTIREGRTDELDRLVALRRAMFEGMGIDDPDVLDRVSDASKKYFLENMLSGLFRVWVACASGVDTVDTGGAPSSDEIGTCREGSVDEIGTCEGEATVLTGLADYVGTGGVAGSGQTGTCEGESSAPIEPDEGEPIASIGLVVHSVPPGPSNLAGTEGYVMNLVTLPPWQRRGIARALLAHVLDVLRAEGVPVVSLHASGDGRDLYEELGFSVRDELPEMRMHL
jgi:ribosomal protein S18 acetylase RimI-like enzyme